MYNVSARKNTTTNERHLYDVEHMDQTAQNSTDCHRIQQTLTVITRVECTSDVHVHRDFVLKEKSLGFCTLVQFVDPRMYIHLLRRC